MICGLSQLDRDELPLKDCNTSLTSLGPYFCSMCRILSFATMASKSVIELVELNDKDLNKAPQSFRECITQSILTPGAACASFVKYCRRCYGLRVVEG